MKTKDLENALNSLNNLDPLDIYLSQVEGKLPNSFIAYFLSLDKVKKIDRSDLIKNSGIERTYAYHILSGSKLNPGREKILRFCLAAHLSVEETNRCLKIAKESILYVKSKRDSLIQYGLNQRMSVIDVNLLLEEYGEEGLN